MSRQEKGSRMRMLPPRVQLQQRDALTGSYPTNVRFSIDGRTGNISNGYNDLQTIVFTSSSTNISWQNNLVAYWTMQRNIQNNGLIGGIAFQTEKNISNSSEGFLDATQTNNFASSFYSGYGIVEDFPFVGKIYDVNINTITQSNNATIPFFIPNKNYNFKPRFSFFARASSYTATRAPALVQYVDSNKSLCAFTGSWNEGPSPFTIAGWFKINDTLNEQNSYDLIHGPNRFLNYLLGYAEDYRLSITDSATPNSKKISLTLYSGSVSHSLIATTIDLNENVFFNNWFHVAATYDGKTNRAIPPNPRGTVNSNSLKIYFNGERLSTTVLGLGNFNGFLSGTLPNYGVSFINLIKGPGTMSATGSIAEAAFFNKELTAQEIYEVYSSRVPLNKKGRILAGTGINIDNDPYPIDSNEYMTTFNGDGMLITGSVVKGIADNPQWVHFSPGQELTPFRDNDQPAVDGKSTNDSFFATGSSPLLVGEGFSSPLWSKNKIEIDISVSVPCSATLHVSGYSWNLSSPDTASYGKSFEMLYYNFDQKLWQGIGKGISYGFTQDGSSGGSGDLVPIKNDAMFGFAPGIVNLWDIDSAFKTQVTGVFEWQASAGQPFTNLGFPYHPKYHATSSQLINVNQYINQPFLVEKIVVELSAAYTIFANTYNTASFETGGVFAITSITQSTVPASVNNIFILNQRSPIKYSYSEKMEYSTWGTTDVIITSSLPIQYQLSAGSNLTYVDTVRDIITWGGVSSFAANISTDSYRAGTPNYASAPVIAQTENTKELMTRECIFSSNVEAHDDLTPLSWEGRVYMELQAKSPIRIDRNPEINPVNPPDNVFSYYQAGINGDYSYMDLKYSGGGRNALGITIPNGRNYITPVAQVQQNGSFQNVYNGSKENILVLNEDRYRYNPYILLPTDQLIVGWQQPIMNILRVQSNLRNANDNSNFSEIKFLPGPAKITLYGSYIREGREYNDSLNQLLSSDGIHEVIGE